MRLATRLACLTVALTALAACGGPAAPDSSAPAGPTTDVVDVLGRHVQVRTPSQRILLDGARMLYTTAFLNKQDPVAGVVGWPDDLAQNDPDTLHRYEKKFPQVSQVTRTGQVYDGSFSVEQALELRPDVFVVSAANFQAAQDAHIVERLAAAGVPTVVVDYFVDPLQHTVPSVKLMGRITGHEREADAFAGWWTGIVDRVRSRLAAAKPPPTPTFLWRAPGYLDCCATFTTSNLGQLVTAAGGANIAQGMLPGKQGVLSPEAVLSRNPAVVLTTGANWAPGTQAKPGSFVPLGYDEQPGPAAAQLRSVVDKQVGFDQLGAVRNHRTYVVWHHFYDSPYNALALEWFAKWLHPDQFRDVDPDASMRELHEKFLPVEDTGTFWAPLP
ncbi:ABC transporter substrate-binding protein [Pseudonocardia phyllosphaerae]|uniref:ABC transporter substrate-binding protein n=1 Tax=Pseudonocardia phyllosphaerae TaxID=3390502 RepID=UPI0039782596